MNTPHWEREIIGPWTLVRIAKTGERYMGETINNDHQNKWWAKPNDSTTETEADLILVCLDGVVS